jgi:ribosome-interacting GTPase 1
MMTFEDVPIQLIDMPPITADHSAPGQVGTYRNCDVIAIVIDLSANVGGQVNICLDFLESRNLLIDSETPAYDSHGNALGKKALCICTKADISEAGALERLKQSCRHSFEFVEVSTETGAGIEELSAKLFESLAIIRVYAKPPGKPADVKDPFTLPAGSTVMDLAQAIHRQLAEKLRFARIWGTGVYDGQNAQRTHVLSDKDIVELHFS